MKKLTSLWFGRTRVHDKYCFADDVLVGEKVTVDGQTEVITDVKDERMAISRP